MKYKRTCESHITFGILLVCLLFIATVTLGRASGNIEPVGTNIGAVQFDAVIELNRYSPRSDRHDYTIMFARYWVSPDYYSIAVVWAEPQSTDLFFAVQPPSLCVASNKQVFKVFHDSIKKVDEAYTKPLDERSILRQKFGGYSMGNIRFAEREALAERIYTHDLKDREDANQPDEGIFAVDGGDTRDVAHLKVRSNGQRIDAMKLFNSEQKMLKDISYEYESKGGKSHLCRQSVTLPERPMMVGFNGKGMRVTLDGKEHWYRDLEAKHHAGGRTCSVDCELVKLGDKKVTLPVQVIVRNAKDGRILRSVRMMNIKKVELDAAGVQKASSNFAGFSEQEHVYRKFCSKYWKKQPTDAEKTDIEAIRKLCLSLEEAVGSTGISTGRKLRYLHSLIELDRIIDDELNMGRHYKQYLLKLRENELRGMMLTGGYGVIETLMLRGLRSDGRKLLAHWLKVVLDVHDGESILIFSKLQLTKKRLWGTIVLLEGLVNDKQLCPNVRFEAEALRCLALSELCKLMSTEDVAKKGLLAQVQANWVAHVGKEKLETMLGKGTERARQSFASVADPTESQKALKEQLNKIEQEISDQKKQKTS
jgi:hypothetical protein